MEGEREKLEKIESYLNMMTENSSVFDEEDTRRVRVMIEAQQKRVALVEEENRRRQEAQQAWSAKLNRFAEALDRRRQLIEMFDETTGIMDDFPDLCNAFVEKQETLQGELQAMAKKYEADVMGVDVNTLERQV